MLVLFGIVAAAVLTIAWNRWENVPARSQKLCGVLSIALGVRAVALLTAILLVPLFPTFAWSDEPDTSVAAEADAATDSANSTLASEQPSTGSVDAGKTSDDSKPSTQPTSEPSAKSSDTKSTESAATAVSEGADADKSSSAEGSTNKSSNLVVESQDLPFVRSTPAVLPTAERSSNNLDSPAPIQLPPASDASADRNLSVTPEASFLTLSAEQPASDASQQKTSTPVELESEPVIDQRRENDSTIASSAMVREPVKFITNINYLTPDRPDWLEQPRSYDESADAWLVTVKAGPYRTVRDCEPDLEKEVSIAVADYVKEQLKARYAATFITYSLDDLRRRNIVREQFSEQLGTSLGLMNQVHAKLVFDDSFRQEIEHRWSEITSKSRLAQTGLGAGVVLLLLSTLFSYFKVDTATKGYYTGRLQFATAGAILALVAASVLLAKCIPWM